MNQYTFTTDSDSPKLFEAVSVEKYLPKIGDLIYAVSEVSGGSKIGRWKVEIVNPQKFAEFIKDYSVTTILRPIEVKPMPQVGDEEIIKMAREYMPIHAH